MQFEVLDFFDESIVIVDPAGTIVHFNSSAAKMFDYPVHEIVGCKLDVLLPVDVRVFHRAHMEHFQKSPEKHRKMNDRARILGRRRDGTIFEAEGSISKVTMGNDLFLMAVLRDVADRNAWHVRVRLSEERHRAVLDACPDAILLADAHTARIVDVNDQAARLFGCRAQELIGLHQRDLHPEAERARYERTFREHIHEGRIMVPDAIIQRHDGRVVPVEIAARPTVIGGTPMLVGFFRDITAWKEKERELSDALSAAEAANQAKMKFLASMSHELRTPLNAIIGFSSMIQSEMLGPVGHPNYKEYAGDISDSGHHLLAVISDILEASRIELGVVHVADELIDLAEILSKCVRLVRSQADEAGLTLQVEPSGPVLVRADPRLVRQMVLNLLYNAIKFTPAGGIVRYGVARGSRDAGQAGAELWVADTGPGIAPERLAQVIKPFNVGGDGGKLYDKAGTGLGLAITKGLIEAHQGTLEIRSTLGHGTLVRLLFPPTRMA